MFGWVFSEEEKLVKPMMEVQSAHSDMCKNASSGDNSSNFFWSYKLCKTSFSSFWLYTFFLEEKNWRQTVRQLAKVLA